MERHDENLVMSSLLYLTGSNHHLLEKMGEGTKQNKIG